jgi:hypothetical protein
LSFTTRVCDWKDADLRWAHCSPRWRRRCRRRARWRCATHPESYRRRPGAAARSARRSRRGIDAAVGLARFDELLKRLLRRVVHREEDFAVIGDLHPGGATGGDRDDTAVAEGRVDRAIGVVAGQRVREDGLDIVEPVLLAQHQHLAVTQGRHLNGLCARGLVEIDRKRLILHAIARPRWIERCGKRIRRSTDSMATASAFRLRRRGGGSIAVDKARSRRARDGTSMVGSRCWQFARYTTDVGPASKDGAAAGTISRHAAEDVEVAVRHRLDGQKRQPDRIELPAYFLDGEGG